jgi:hypothetical protein
MHGQYGPAGARHHRLDCSEIDYRVIRKVMIMLQISDVFGKHMPKVTEIDRSQNNDVEALSDLIGNPGCLLRLHGPSKSGKTVLVRQIMRQRNLSPITVHGSNVSKIEDLWISIASNAPDLFPELVDTVNTRQQIDVINYCKDSKRPILIDDFHGIPAATRKAVLKVLKQLVCDHEVAVTVVSVADIVRDLISNDTGLIRDFHRKTEQIKAPLWRKEEIQQIGSKGFSALELTIPKTIVDTLAHHSFRNPLLMQAYCEDLSRLLRRSNLKAMDPSSSPDILKGIFEKVARQDQELYQKTWSKGGANFKLKSGREINIRGLVLLSMSHIALVTPLNLSNSRIEIRDLLENKKDTPTLRELRNAALDLINASNVVDLKETGIFLLNDQLYITHPFFKIYLIWVLYPNFTEKFPDIKTYVERQPLDAQEADGQ